MTPCAADPARSIAVTGLETMAFGDEYQIDASFRKSPGASLLRQTPVVWRSGNMRVARRPRRRAIVRGVARGVPWHDRCTRRRSRSSHKEGSCPTVAPSKPRPAASRTSSAATAPRRSSSTRVFLNADLWDGVVDGVSDVRRCIAPDILCHGQTRERADADVSFAGQAQMLLQLVDALDVRQVDLVANDSGGAIAQIFAARHPERVRSLALTNCDVHDGWPPPAFVPTVQAVLTAGFRAVAGPLTDPAVAREALGVGFEHPERLSDATLRGFLDPLLASDERVKQPRALLRGDGLPADRRGGAAPSSPAGADARHVGHRPTCSSTSNGRAGSPRRFPARASRSCCPTRSSSSRWSGRRAWPSSCGGYGTTLRRRKRRARERLVEHALRVVPGGDAGGAPGVALVSWLDESPEARPALLPVAVDEPPGGPGSDLRHHALLHAEQVPVAPRPSCDTRRRSGGP